MFSQQTLPADWPFTSDEQAKLDKIRADAMIRFEKFKKAERFKGRKHFPDLPYEFSWAYEEEFRREVRGGRR